MDESTTRRGTDTPVHRPDNLPTMRETWVQSLGQEDPLKEGSWEDVLEKEMATHSSILA